MSVALPKPLTLDAFLDWEETQPLRYEFDGYHPVAMTGGTGEHSAIQSNIAVSIRGRLRGAPCRFYGNDLKIEVAGRVRYPDGFVVCTPVPRGATIVRDPVVIFEVLSDGTAKTDFGEKNAEYAATPSVLRYVLLFQDRIAGVMFERIGDDWVGHLLPADSVLRMPEIGIEVPLAEFYIDVDLSPAEPSEDAQ